MHVVDLIPVVLAVKLVAVNPIAVMHVVNLIAVTPTAMTFVIRTAEMHVLTLSAGMANAVDPIAPMLAVNSAAGTPILVMHAGNPIAVNLAWSLTAVAAAVMCAEGWSAVTNARE